MFILYGGIGWPQKTRIHIDIKTRAGNLEKTRIPILILYIIVYVI